MEEDAAHGSKRPRKQEEDSPCATKKRKSTVDVDSSEYQSLPMEDKAFILLEDFSNNTPAIVDPPPTSEASGLLIAKSQLEQKIRSCLEFLEKLNEQHSSTNELSDQQALVFIYFVETFALQGTGDEEMNDKLQKNLAPNYMVDDRKKISNVREALLKRSNKKLDLKDVKRCIKVDVQILFKELQNYVQYVLAEIGQATHTGSVPSLEELIETPKNEFGTYIADVETFLAEEFDKLLSKAFTKENWTWTDLFDYVVNFYPIFKKNSELGSKKLSELRNRLLHQFNKYGNVQFGNEMVGMRHELLKYHFAKKVYKVVCDIKQDDKWKEIDENLKEQCANYPGAAGGDAVIPQGAANHEAKGFHGYKFSKSMLPKEVSNFKELAYQYFKFKILTHNFMEKEDEEEEDEEEEEEEKRKDSIKATNSQSRTKLIDSDRREMFEEFDKLERLRTESEEEYPERKKRFKEILVNKYGIKKNHFEETYKFFEEHDGKLILKSGSDEAESIAKILVTLKDIRERNPKLSNKVIISLYDRFVRRQTVFNFRESRNLLKNVADDGEPQTIEAQMKKLPEDKRIKLQINDTTLFVPIGEVTKDMLSIFCNAYDTYRVEFEIKDIFNDDTILDYMVCDETEEVDVEKLVDPYFKFIFRIESESVRVPRREVFDGFLRLKEILELQSKQIYDIEKKKFATELEEKYGVETTAFEEVCESFVENDGELTDDEKKNVQQLFKNKKKPAIEVLRGKPKDLYKKTDFEKLKSVVTVKTLGNNVGDVLDTFKEKRRLKDRNKLRIQELLNINYAAPYIVRLLKKVKSDESVTKNDLKRLIEILLNDQECFYIKHLNDLLYIKSTKLNLYNEVCTRILETGFNVENMLLIFNESQHVDGILTELVEYMDSKNGMDELMTTVLGLLNSVVLELILFNEDDIALEILNGKLKGTYDRLLNEKKIGKNDQIWVHYQSNLVKMKNVQGKKKEQSALHEEALEILEELLNNCDKSNVTQYLLVLCNKAYTLKLLRKYKESYKVYEDLFVEIVKFVLGNDVRDLDITDKTYGEIESSEKYRYLRESSEESQRYLDILDIGHNMAYTLVNHAVKYEPDRDTAIKNCEKSLKIYKVLHCYTHSKFKSEQHQETVQIMRQLSRTYILSSMVMFKHSKSSPNRVEDCRKALEYVREGLAMNIKILEIQVKKDNNFHIPIKNLRKHFVVKNINRLAETCNELGRALPDNDPEKVSHHQKALEIYKKIHEFRNRMNCSENDGLGTLGHLAYTYNELGQALPRNDPEKVSHHQEALKIYENIHDFEKRMNCSENDGLRTLGHLAYTYNKLGRALPRNDPEKVSHHQEALKIYENIHDFEKRMNCSENDGLRTLGHLAYTYNELGQALPRNDREKVSHHQEALKIYENIHDFEKRMNCSENDGLRTLGHLAYTYNELGRALPRNDPEKVSHHQKALKIYENIHDFEKRMNCSENDGLGTLGHLAYTYNKLGWALPRNDPEKVSPHQEALKIYENIHDFEKRMNCTQKDKLRTLDNIANTYSALGFCVSRDREEKVSSCEKALEKYKEALALTEIIYTSESQNYLQTCKKVADIHSRLYFLIRSRDSLEHYEASLEFYEFFLQSPQVRPDDTNIPYVRDRITNLREECAQRANPRETGG